MILWRATCRILRFWIGKDSAGVCAVVFSLASTRRPRAHGVFHANLFWPAAGRDPRMKVVYNWLKELVAVSATPQELASRLALSGTNIGGIENGPHGAVIDAEVSSNRPDCLGHYGIAR